MAVKLWGVDESGLFNEKQLDHLISDLKILWRIYHGPDVALDRGDPDLQLIQSVSVEARNLWSGAGAAYYQTFITLATGAALDLAVDILDMDRRLAQKASGEVTFSRNAAAPVGGITVPAGTVVANAAGIQFTTDASATILEGQTQITTPVSATLAGSSGNLAPGTVTVLISTVNGVDAVANGATITGGSDKESDDALKARALANPSLRGGGTTNAIRSRVAGVSTKAHVLVNNGFDTTADDYFWHGTGTGTDSEQANQAQAEALAVKFTVPSGGRWVQDLRIRGKHGAGIPTLTIAVQTNAGGFPSGVAASSNLQVAGVIPANNADTLIHFARPAFLAAGTYHLKMLPTAGDFNLVGAAHVSGTDVSFYNGATWATSTLVQNGNVDIIAGMKPNSVQAYVLGGDNLVIAQTLLAVVGGGIGTNGDIVQTLQDDSGNNQEIRFSRPILVPVYTDVTVKVSSDFDATNGPNAIRNAIIRYLGGTDTGGNVQAGLSLGDDVYRTAVSAAVQGITGVLSVQLLKLDTVNPPVATTGDISIAGSSVAQSEASSGIDVTVVP